MVTSSSEVCRDDLPHEPCADISGFLSGEASDCGQVGCAHQDRQRCRLLVSEPQVEIGHHDLPWRLPKICGAAGFGFGRGRYYRDGCGLHLT
eukprot:symbB.v1.2.025216.t1/scaffold2438.1/size79063/1